MNHMNVVKTFSLIIFFLICLSMIKAVKQLDFAYNQIGDRGARNIADILQSNSVRILRLLTSNFVIINFFN